MSDLHSECQDNQSCTKKSCFKKRKMVGMGGSTTMCEVLRQLCRVGYLLPSLTAEDRPHQDKVAQCLYISPEPSFQLRFSLGLLLTSDIWWPRIFQDVTPQIPPHFQNRALGERLLKIYLLSVLMFPSAYFFISETQLWMVLKARILAVCCT